MWTKLTDVTNFANYYLKDVTIDEIISFFTNAKIEISKEEIEECFHSNYEVYVKSLKIYNQKIHKFIKILTLIQVGKIGEFLIEEFDLTIENDKILTRDLIRILKPLKKNYQLAVELHIKANDKSTYLKENTAPITGRLKSKIPNSSIVNSLTSHSDEKMELTDKQKSAIYLRKQELRKKICSNFKNSENVNEL